MASSRGSSPRFDEERAKRAQDFFEKILNHTKGRWARKSFVLADWQRDDVLRPLFGTVRRDPSIDEWVRQYRVAWLELARKNGKSELLAGIALLLLCADDEEGAEVYGAAKDREQASLVFDVARRMVELSPLLSRRLQIFPSNKRIVDPKTSSFYRVIAADATGNLGQNPHGIVFDEVIAQPNRELWDALRTGMGARTQPLMVAATTAGNDPSSFAAVEHEYCEQISRDPSLDPTRFVYIRNTPKDADWREERNWQHANPALGDFLSIDALREEAREADLSSAAQNRFRQFRLNQWVQQHTRWLDIDAWDASGGEVDEERLRGCRCFGGLDLASSVDLAALCWDFPDADGGHDVVWRFFIPSARIKDLDTRTGGRGSAWVRAGLVETTEGEVIDYAAVLDRIDRDARNFDIAELAYDRWGMTQLSQMLADAGLVVVPFSQTIVALSPATKELERLVLEGRYRHGGNPVMRWMMDNVAIRSDSSGNVKPDKQKSGDRIDGVIAGVMALDRADRHEPAAEPRIRILR